MAQKYRDTDYLHATARVRAMENSMLSGKDLRKMIDAKCAEEAYKVLADAVGQGYALANYEQALNHNLKEAYRLVETIAPNPVIVSIFRYKYDGHNLKTLIKAKKTAADRTDILSDLGNVSAETVAAELNAERFEKVNPILGAAALEALEALAKSGDPQQVDLHMDKAVLEAMYQAATEFDNAFLTRFVAAQIDIANLRTAVRMLRMGKEVFALNRIMVEGGSINLSRISEAYLKGAEELTSLIAASDYGKYLEPAFAALRGKGSLTLFEKLCDNYLVSLLGNVKTVPFGVEPLIAYLFAKEAETKAARIVMASKLANVSAQQITERLRDTYA